MNIEYISSLFEFAGGIGMFLYGMNTMADGMQRSAGGKMKKLLGYLTSNRLLAIIVGAVITAIIQSSGATTVMVVGFVNAGLMTLVQAVGVIMGANIGTTMTSWLLSLTGIQGESIFMQLLKPTSFTPILAIIGIFFIMMSKSSMHRSNDQFSGRTKVFPAAWMEEYMRVPFENAELSVISSYDKMLCDCYGKDYMIPIRDTRNHDVHEIVRGEVRL